VSPETSRLHPGHHVHTSWTGKINPGKVFDLTLPPDEVAEGYRALDERRAIKTLTPAGTRGFLPAQAGDAPVTAEGDQAGPPGDQELADVVPVVHGYQARFTHPRGGGCCHYLG
jgi:hypothetical protein